MFSFYPRVLLTRKLHVAHDARGSPVPVITLHWHLGLHPGDHLLCVVELTQPLFSFLEHTLSQEQVLGYSLEVLNLNDRHHLQFRE